MGLQRFLAQNLSGDRARQTASLGFFYLFVVVVSIAVGIPVVFDSDAYYYFTISRNIASGSGSTFDGVSVTTGFHPLWLGISAGVHYVFNDAVSFHYAIRGILTILFISGHFLLARVAVHLGINLRAFLLVSLLLLVLNLAVFHSGLENTLVFFLLSLFLWQQFKDWGSGRTMILANSLVLLLVYFARLDSIFLVALYLSWFFVNQWRAGNHTAAMSLPVIVIACLLRHCPHCLRPDLLGQDFGMTSS